MTGNPKAHKWNKPGGANSTANVGTAVTLEEAIRTARRINSRVRRDNKDVREMTKMEIARSKITLSSPEWLAEFMRRPDDEDPEA